MKVVFESKGSIIIKGDCEGNLGINTYVGGDQMFLALAKEQVSELIQGLTQYVGEGVAQPVVPTQEEDPRILQARLGALKNEVTDIREEVKALRAYLENSLSNQGVKELLDEGWILRAGDKCPVSRDTLVQVKFRSGAVNNNPCPAAARYWRCNGVSSDIVAYKVVNNQ